jgi:arsenate reductase
MAEGYLKSYNPSWTIVSAGTKPAEAVNPYAISVMKEVGIDISKNKPKMVDEFLAEEFDYVITVCDGAKESCPMFIGTVKHHIHIGFEDPADSVGSEEEKLLIFRKVRDQIKTRFRDFSKSV